MKHWISGIFLLLAITSLSQNKVDSRFIEYLMSKEYHKEVVYLINNVNTNELETELKDSLHYMRGWSLYSQKKLFQSANDLNKVSSESPFYHKSKFFAGYNLMHLGDYNGSRKIFVNTSTAKPSLLSLKHFELAGLALLERNYVKYNQHISQTDTTYYAIAKESGKLNQYATDLKTHKKRSPVLASIMSGVIPGSGKLYAGQTGEGISSLLAVGGLGFVTWENYRKRGLKDIKTLFFGAVFTTFYVGNIYGTYFSVKIAEDEFQKEYDNKILFNLHIPLRNVFN